MRENQTLDELVLSIREQLGEIEDEHGPDFEATKFSGRFRYGCRVRITWYGDVDRLDAESDFEDLGVLIALPGFVNADDEFLGGVVYVPEPSNPGGKDAIEPRWVTLKQLGFNDFVRHVEALEPLA